MVKNLKGEAVESKLQLIDPHTLLNYLLTDHGIRIDAEAVSDFWETARKNGLPWALAHPATSQHIPCAIYYDSCTFAVENVTIKEKCFVIQLSLPLWRPKTTRNSRWTICAVREDITCDDARDTLYPVLRHVTASLNRAFRAEGLCFALTEIRGDWEGHKLVLGMSSSWKATDLCHQCGVKQYGRSPNFQSIDAWLAVEYSHLEFLKFVIDPTKPCQLHVLA